MKPYLILIVLFLLPLPFILESKDQPVNQLMEAYLWQQRPVLLFASSPDSQELQRFNGEVSDSITDTNERDMVIWHIIHDTHVAIDGAIRPHLPARRFYDFYNIDPDATAALLIGKDGEIKQRYDIIPPLTTLFEEIDAMPMRQQEISNQNAAEGNPPSQAPVTSTP